MMPAGTCFLARSIGLFTLLMTGATFVHESIVETAVRDPGVMQIYAITSLGLGVPMIVGHNVWSKGLLPAVVSLVGWLALVKGIVLLLMPAAEIQDLFQRMHYSRYVYAYLSPAFLTGVYLTLAGFRGAHSD